MTPKQLADAAFADPKKRAAWLDPETAGLFARVADAGHRVDDLEAAFGAIPSAEWPGMADWPAVVTACRRVAMASENAALEAGASQMDVRLHREAAPEVVRLLIEGGIAAGELVPTIAPDLSISLRETTARAILVAEMRDILLAGARLHRCSWCGGWHRVGRDPAGGPTYCRDSCRMAAHAARQAAKARADG